MGKVALAAKITHVPSMYLSELDGPRKGTRQDAIEGHVEIGRRCRELGVDTIVVFDTHWLVNASYHVNCAPRFAGTYTSNELPHFISNMAFEFPGNPALGQFLRALGTLFKRLLPDLAEPHHGLIHPLQVAGLRQAPPGFGSEPDTYRYDVIFLKEPLTSAEAMQSVSTKDGVDQAFAGNGVLYFSRLISKATQSHLPRIIGLPVYQNMTIRNWNTTTKLLVLMEKE